jgi:hypothetical protein
MRGQKRQASPRKMERHNAGSTTGEGAGSTTGERAGKAHTPGTNGRRKKNQGRR